MKTASPRGLASAVILAFSRKPDSTVPADEALARVRQAITAAREGMEQDAASFGGNRAEAIAESLTWAVCPLLLADVEMLYGLASTAPSSKSPETPRGAAPET